jgi:uncharacterized membrane protein YkgB
MIIKRSGYHILRVSMAVTFLWISVLIFKSPLFWTGFLPVFVLNASPISAVEIMYIVAVVDAIIGVMFLVDWKVHWAGLFAALHMLGILAVSGIDDITVRDIAIMGAGVALLSETMPDNWRAWLHKKAKPSGGKM